MKRQIEYVADQEIHSKLGDRNQAHFQEVQLVFTHILELFVKGLKLVVDIFTLGCRIFYYMELAEDSNEEVRGLYCTGFKESNAYQHQGNCRMHSKTHYDGNHK